MELKDFISDAITHICEGVKDAQIKCDNVGARVSSPIHNDRIVEGGDLIHWKYTNILFKVALQSNDINAANLELVYYLQTSHLVHQKRMFSLCLL